MLAATIEPLTEAASGTVPRARESLVGGTQQQSKPLLLTIVEALVERLGRIGQLLQAGST